MVPKIPIATHNMDTQIEDKTLPWYLINVVIDPYTGDILQYKDLIQLKKKKQETYGKTDFQRNFDNSQTDFQEKRNKEQTLLVFLRPTIYQW